MIAGAGPRAVASRTGYFQIRTEIVRVNKSLINKYIIEPPIVNQAGDIVKIVGKRLEQWRGNVLVRLVNLVESEKLTEVVAVGGQVISELFLEVGMLGQNVSIVSVRENSTGSILVEFSNGHNAEYANWAAIGEIADSIDSSPDIAEKILLGKSYRASPDGANKTTQVGASVSCNLLADSPVVYTRPE